MKTPYGEASEASVAAARLYRDQVEQDHQEPYYSFTTRTTKLVYPRNYLTVNCPVHGGTYATGTQGGAFAKITLACGCNWNSGGGTSEGWWRDEDCEWLSTQQMRQRLKEVVPEAPSLPEKRPVARAVLKRPAAQPGVKKKLFGG